MSLNLILEILPKSVEKLRKQQADQDDRAYIAHTNNLKKSKPRLNDDAKLICITSSKDSPENLSRALVYNHLLEVAPELAKQFGTELMFKRTDLQLRELVKVFNKSKQSERLQLKVVWT